MFISCGREARGGTSRQISGRAGYRVRKLNSGPGPGRVITMRSIFFSSIFHTVKAIVLWYGQNIIDSKYMLLYMKMYCVVISC